jgi:hypothetical protein
MNRAHRRYTGCCMETFNIRQLAKSVRVPISTVLFYDAKVMQINRMVAKPSCQS